MFEDLKSGSDIRGTALEGYGENVNLNDEAVLRLSRAFCLFLNIRLKKTPLKIAVGHDSRLSSPHIKELVCGALTQSGATVLDCGLTSTPSMFMMTVFHETGCDASVMITASHHPVPKNGLKFFTKDGGLESADISEIIKLAQNDSFVISDTHGSVIKDDYNKLYCDFIIDKIRAGAGGKTPLKGFKIVVDAGNGAGGFFAERILKPLGADIEGSQFLEPDGFFPNHAPNPEDKTAMSFISRCVTDNKADLGIIFDTDVDRAAIVSSDGKEINRNRLIALISAVLLEESKGAYIVTDSVTSDGLKSFISDCGGVHHRFKRGYKNVINEAVRLNKEGKNAVLAIETSGHAAFKENFFLDDGAYLVSRLLIKMAQLKKKGKSLTDLIAGLTEPVEDAEARLTFTTNEWKECGESLIRKLKDFGATRFSLEGSSYEGVRINVEEFKGWFMARMSVHDPIMPVNIESQEINGVKNIAKIFVEFIKAHNGIDVTPLKKFL